MLEQKYVVFKKSDWDEWVANMHQPKAPEVTDLFVIRFQDVFSTPGLYAYAAGIQTYIEALNQVPVDPSPWDLPERLEQLRDMVFEAAQQAQDFPHKKVPD